MVVPWSEGHGAKIDMFVVAHFAVLEPMQSTGVRVLMVCSP